LSLKAREPLTVPLALGENVTLTLQFPSAPILVPQLLLEMANPLPQHPSRREILYDAVSRMPWIKES
jgi:hypothetical protein